MLLTEQSKRINSVAFQAVIFDMDGVLIDSEPLWHQAEQQILGGLGVDFNQPPLLQSTGLTTASVIAHWYQHQPWPELTPAQVQQRIIDFVATGIASEGNAKTGLPALLEAIAAQQLKIAVATNSPKLLLDTTLQRLNITHYFDARCHLELVKQGKPAPDIYLLAAEKLGVAPQHCLVFEDSFAGVTAAKAAGMTVVAIPAEHEWHQSKFELADHKIRCFTEFDYQHWLQASAKE
jgi:beta-phosphoglucomutase-like phosphatase (HAD superfamily)